MTSRPDDNGFLVEEESGGKKNDGGKPRWDLLDFDFIEEVVKVATFGAEKYGAYNWQKVTKTRYISAAFRHIKAAICGEKNDKETGLSHFAHATCCLMFLFWFERNKK